MPKATTNLQLVIADFVPQQLTVTADDTGLLVKPEIARQQIDQETAASLAVDGDATDQHHPQAEASRHRH